MQRRIVDLHFHGTRPLLPVVPFTFRNIPATRACREAPSRLAGEATPPLLPLPGRFLPRPSPGPSRQGPVPPGPPQPFLGRFQAAHRGGWREPGRQRPPSAAAPRSPGTGSRQRTPRPRPRAPRHAAISTAASLPPEGRSGPGRRCGARPSPAVPSPWPAAERGWRAAGRPLRALGGSPRAGRGAERGRGVGPAPRQGCPGDCCAERGCWEGAGQRGPACPPPDRHGQAGCCAGARSSTSGSVPAGELM